MLTVESLHWFMYPVPLEKFGMQVKYLQMSPGGLVIFAPRPQ